DATPALQRSLRVPARAGARGEAELRPRALSDDAPGDHLDGRIADGVAVDRAVGGLERRANLVTARGLESALRDRHADLVALLPIAHVREPAEAHALGGDGPAEDGQALRLHLGDRARHGLPVQRVQGPRE